MAKKKPARRDDAARRRAEYRRGKSAEYSRSDSTSIRDIGPIPKIANKRRRTAAMRSLLKFATTYFPERFTLAFSPDHKKVFRRGDAAIDGGELFALAMPRGSGKSTIAEVAALKAIFSGRHPMIAIIGSDKESAVDMLESIKIEIETNELLAADFPEICFPVVSLDGINHRCKGQTCCGVRTRIEWGANRIVLPTIEGSPASGVAVRTYGITGRIRGAKHRRADGDSVRPSFVVLDDIQTDESAWSPSQCEHRERIVKGAVLGLAGPGKRVSGIVPITVIRGGDAADRLLDRKLNPEFHGERMSLLYAFPKRADLWERYNDLRVAELEADRGLAKATAFYRKHRKQMQLSARVAWPARFDAAAGEVDALQHAMNLYFTDPYAFACEYQNQPPANAGGDDEFLDAAAITRRINDLDAGVVPDDAAFLVAGVDVQKTLLYYVVLALRADFTAYIVEYGSFPKQPTNYFTLRSATRKFASVCEATTVEGRLRESLAGLIEADLYARTWRRSDGAEMRLAATLIDAQWGDMRDVVYSFIGRSAIPNLLPSHGVYIGAATTPIGEEKRKAGELLGLNWKVSFRSGVRRVVFDSNFWKTFAARRLATPAGDPGSATLYCAPPSRHRLIGDHVTAESPTVVSARGRDVVEWKLAPNRPDNHLFDCLSQAFCAGSIVGCALPGQAPPKRKKAARRNVSYL